MRFSLIIPSGGVGKRFGGDIPKQYLEINSIPIIIRTIKAFERIEPIENCIISAHKHWHDFILNQAEKHKIKMELYFAENGEQRQHSVYNAIKNKKCSGDFVLIHDAVRPFICKDIIMSVINGLNNFEAVIPVIPAKDTIKEINPDGTVNKTLERSKLFLVQTPQGFKKDILIKAYDYAFKNNFIGTDDASIAEFSNILVKVVSGNSKNIKITNPEDIL
jgi:2-C-methyl-D-erythritol 4-phosphate cytidylyltransferase